MGYTHIRFSVQNSVAEITLNRPNVLNSFNREMALELQEALDVCRDNKEIRVIYITGEGRAFCAGQDLAEAIAPGSPSIGQIVNDQYNPIITKIRAIEKPVICAVNGVAAGAGANIAIACDIVMAAKSASFIQSFSKIGLIPDSGGTFFLPRLVGVARATAMMMLGEKITSDQAFNFGLIYKVCDDDKLREESMNLVSQMATLPTRAFGLTKKAINLSFSNDLSDQLEVEKDLQSQAGNSYDYKEGVSAFLEKRKPVFKGE